MSDIDIEVPVYEEVQLFNRGREYETMNWQQIETGNARGVNVAVLIHYYRRGTLPIQPFNMALAKYIREVQLSDENSYSALYTAAILSDSGEVNVAAAERDHFVALYDGDPVARHEIRDFLKELIYQGKEPKWLKSYLIERAEAERP